MSECGLGGPQVKSQKSKVGLGGGWGWVTEALLRTVFGGGLGLALALAEPVAHGGFER